MNTRYSIAPADTDGGVTAAAIEDDLARKNPRAIEKEAKRNVDGDPYCHAEHDEFWCSREPGHDGPHIAATADLQHSIGEVWGQDVQAMAALWKEVARRQTRRLTEMTAHRDRCRDIAMKWQVEANMRKIRAEDTLSLVQQQRDQATARAEKAERERDRYRASAENWQATAEEWEEKCVRRGERITELVQERDEARNATCTDKDAHWRLDEAQETIQRLTRERDEAIAFMTEAQEEATRQAVRADTAEKERGKARDGARVAFARCRELDEARQKAVDELYRLRADDPRPLSPDAITDEMVERALRVLREMHEDGDLIDGSMVAHQRVAYAVLAAALTEPPARPEGAEELRPILVEFAKENAARAGAGDDLDLADFLAERGVRVVGEERS